MRILHVAAECHPLIKTGGLADVVGSLPAAQRARGHRVAVLLPGYSSIMTAARALEPIHETIAPGNMPTRILRGQLDGDVELLIVDQPDYFARPGGPYSDELGRDWPDNHRRFALLGWVGAWLCRPDSDYEILHAHDWHAGLAPAYLKSLDSDCASCFTIHNLAYQGRFGNTQYAESGLPWEFYRFDGLEYHGDWSFMKAGLAFCDAITTVSPTYAREIMTPELGMGLQALLDHRRNDVYGILNGVDYSIWDPATDPALARNYSEKSLARKAASKQALQQAHGLEVRPRRPLFGVVSRLTMQKGLDLALEAIESLLAAGKLQLVLLGSGDAYLESAFLELAQRFPANCAVTIGYSETEAHRIIGGADAILVPSRFEPCGLTQLYGLRYGTLPVVRRTGGLADTVTGYNGRNPGEATGFEFQRESSLALKRTLIRAAVVYRERKTWNALMRNAMRRDYSWDRSAQAYIDLYRQILAR